MQGARASATRGIRKVAGTPSRLSAAGKRLASNLRGKTSAADKQLRASYTAGTPGTCSALHVVQMTLSVMHSTIEVLMSTDTHVALNCLTYIHCVSLTLQLKSAQTLESGAHRLHLYPGGEALPAHQLSTLAAWPGVSLPLQQRRHQYFQLLMPTSQTICCRYEAEIVTPPSFPSFLPESNCKMNS